MKLALCGYIVGILVLMPLSASAPFPHGLDPAAVAMPRQCSQEISNNEREWIFYSQQQEDVYALQFFFRNLTKGTALELGAFDGIRASNTAFFERYRGWKGLLVEPSPGSFQLLSKVRECSVRVNAAVCNSPTLVEYLDKGSVFGGIYEFLPPDRQKEARGSKDLVNVSCVPLQMLLDTFGMVHVDFFSLDVEGAELQVLQTVDFQKLQVDVMVVEMESGEERNQAVRDFLGAVGFTSHGVLGVNEWFVHGKAPYPRKPGGNVTALLGAWNFAGRSYLLQRRRRRRRRV